MNKIFPFMPLTDFMLNLEINLSQYTHDKIKDKLKEAAESLKKGDKPKPWGPFANSVQYEGQKIDFHSNFVVSQGHLLGQPETETVFEIKFQNHISFFDGKKENLEISEIIKATFPSKGMDNKLNHIDVSCRTFLAFRTPNAIPASVKPSLIGMPFKALLELPGEMNQCIGDAKITVFNGQIVDIDVSAFEAETLKLHKNFIKSGID